MEPRQEAPTLYQRIYAMVRAVPPGRVATYGQIAALVGTGARQVGYALAALGRERGVPWHRIINHRGEISERRTGAGGIRQRRALADEGVLFDARGRVDFERFGWSGPGPPERG